MDALLALQRGAGNRAVTRLLQRDSYEETAAKFDRLNITYNYTRKRHGVLDLLKPYAAAMERHDTTAAYRLVAQLVGALEEFRLTLDQFLENDDGKADAVKSLEWWLARIAAERATIEDTGRAAAIDADRQAGKLLYGEPPLTLAEGERLMDGLRQGVRPAGANLRIGSEVAVALAGNVAEREFGLGTLTPDAKSEAVIIAGAATATPFPSFPYLTTRGHSHPVKPHVKSEARTNRYGTVPAKLRAAETLLDLAFGDYDYFGIDLLPSREDLKQAQKDGVPHTVFVNYKFDKDTRMVVNPAVPNPTRDVAALPWIDFVISNVRSVDDSNVLQFSLALVAGETRLDFNLRTDHGPWLAATF